MLGYLLLTLASAAPDRPGRFQVETRRVPSYAETMIRENRQGEPIAQLQKRVSEQENARDVHQQQLSSYYDDLYVGDVKLGTPPQTFSVRMDTSTADMWVIDAKIAKDSRNLDTPSIDSNQSFFLDQYDSIYSDYKVAAEGNMGVDVIDLSGMTFKSQGFGVATKVTPYVGKMQMDGYLGLAWPAAAQSPNTTPPLQNMLDQMEQPLFTVFMARNQERKEGAVDGGRITFGGFDNGHCDSKARHINYVSINSKETWQIKIDDFAIGKQKMKKSYSEVFTDSTVSYIGVPPEAMNAILIETTTTWNSTYQIQTVDCNTHFPDMVFTISGIEYRVPSFEYVVDVGLGQGNCLLAVFGAPQHSLSNPQSWILGQPFMRQFCLVHDIGNVRLGISQSINVDTSTGAGSRSSIIILLVLSIVASLMHP